MAGRCHRRGHPFVYLRLAYLLVLCHAETHSSMPFGGLHPVVAQALDPGASLSSGPG